LVARQLRPDDPSGPALRDALQARGYRVEWREYPMPHSVCPEEIADISAFLLRIL
jgi:phospholipase/carboxylesterase